jgi:hypothetical protein
MCVNGDVRLRGIGHLHERHCLGHRARCAARSNEIVANAFYRSEGMDYAHEAFFGLHKRIMHSLLRAVWFRIEGPSATELRLLGGLMSDVEIPRSSKRAVTSYPVSRKYLSPEGSTKSTSIRPIGIILNTSPPDVSEQSRTKKEERFQAKHTPYDPKITIWT